MGILNQIVGQQPFLTTQVQPHPAGFLTPHTPPPFWDPKQGQPGQQGQQGQAGPGQAGLRPDQQPGNTGSPQGDIWDRIFGGHGGIIGKPGMGNSAGGPPMAGAPPGAPASSGVMGNIMQAFNGAGGAAGGAGMGLDIAKLMAMMG